MSKLVIAITALSLATVAYAADPPKAEKAAPAAEAKKPDAAAAAPTGAPPPPAPELAKNMKGMEGKWKCEGKFPDSAFGKAHNSKGTMEMKSDLNGYFYMARYEEKKAKDNPMPWVMVQTIGFDPSKSDLVRTDVDGMGGITHLTSKGFEGDKLTWTGDVMGGPQKLTFTETLTKNAKGFDIAMEMGPEGAQAHLGDMSCKK